MGSVSKTAMIEKRIKKNSPVATYPTIIPAIAKPVCDVFPTLFNLPHAICPMIAPMKENKPAVRKIQEIDTANEAVAKPLAFCS